MDSVSVIIPVFRDSQRLRQCLSALARQTYPAELIEVIVADNGSPQETRAVLADFPGVRLVEEPTGGSYAARNAGLRVARGPCIAFTDSDCVPHADWLAAGVAAMDVASGMGFVAGRIEVTFRVPATPNLWEALDFVAAFPQEEFVKSGFGATANVFTHVDVIAAIGPFRSDMFSSGDVEWGRRATASGRRGVYVDATVVSHPARASWTECSRKMRRQYHGYMANGTTPSWRDTLTGRARSIRLPRGLLSRSEIPWKIRWRAVLAAKILGLLENWVRVLVLVIGRPTLLPRSIKGW